MAKTQEEIAFEMLSKLKGLGVWGEQNKDEILDLFAECLVFCANASTDAARCSTSPSSACCAC